MTLMMQLVTFKGTHLQRIEKFKGPVTALPNQVPGAGQQNWSSGNQMSFPLPDGSAGTEAWAKLAQEALAIPDKHLQYYTITSPAPQVKLLKCLANPTIWKAKRGSSA
ncbi:hypothetical protein P7K49_024078 [Saguinus oedipus]|uniref:Uncharacterized protein n=1 Tax=Saguinus oedipus TaxID=9490 RepID=A0ABQ9UNI4_SAGOE|nr:hypothetical protein P7K49_024078 [Saguinus oedipus]